MNASTRLVLTVSVATGLVALLDLWAAAGARWIWPEAEVLTVVLAVSAGAVVGWALSFYVPGPHRFGALRQTIPWITGWTLVAGVLAVLLIRADVVQELPQGPARPGTDPDAPDIVVLLLDAVRADGIHDPSGRVFPHLAQLAAVAEEGVVYTQARSTSPWTVPGHASLFTGLLPHEHGATAETPMLDPGLRTVAERLQGRGYRTVGIVANPWLSRTRGFAQGFEIYEEVWHQGERLPLVGRIASRLGIWNAVDQHHKRKKTDIALRRLQEILQAPREGGPRFVFVNLISAHPPLGAPDPHLAARLSEETRTMGRSVWSIPQDWPSMLTGAMPSSEVEQRVLRELYDGEITYMDTALGPILDGLRDSGQWERTHLVVTSDHGCGLGEEGRFGAGFDLHDRMLRIPLLVKPVASGPGRTDDRPVQLHDLQTSLLRAGGVEPPAPVRDADARPLDASPRRRTYTAFARPVHQLHVLWQRAPRYDRSWLDRRLLGVQEGALKLVWSDQAPPRLVRADLDPTETRDWTVDLPDNARALEAAFQEGLGLSAGEAAVRLRAFSSDPEDLMTLDAATEETLRSLGYISGNR